MKPLPTKSSPAPTADSASPVSRREGGNAPDHCLISVVVPTRNAQGFLRPCLESLSRQTFTDFEIVVVDGGSSDGTVALIEEMAGRFKNLRWVSECDAGVYNGMNKGVRLARGPWLYFLGADDRLQNERVFEEVARHLDGTADMVYGNVMLENHPWGRDGTIYGREFSVRDITLRNICHQGIFYSRHVLEKFGGYDLRYPIFADWDLNLRLFKKVRKKYLPLTVARFRGGGLSARVKDPEFELHFVEILTRELELDARSPLYRDQARGLRHLWQHYARRGKPGLALKFFALWLRHEKFIGRGNAGAAETYSATKEM